MLQKQLISLHDWQQLWNRRNTCVGGSFALLRACSDAQQVSFLWTDSTTISAGPFSYSLTNASSLSRPQQAHHLRDVLRCAGLRAEAARRPKDFEGVEDGIVEVAARDACSSRCGPSLLTGGQWTAWKMNQAYPHLPPVCPRCGISGEYLEHRLWTCPANAVALRDLHIALQQHMFPVPTLASLPPCLRRCGLIPKSWADRPGVKAIVSYLLRVSNAATDALASAWPGFGHPLYNP